MPPLTFWDRALDFIIVHQIGIFGGITVLVAIAFLYTLYTLFKGKK